MPENILLVCWEFPPNYGIGGRRWAKFAKELAGMGYTLHVVKSSPSKNNKLSSWTKDVSHQNIKIYNLETYWAIRWLNDYTSFFSPFKIRFAQLYLKLFFKGTIYDKALGTRKQFMTLSASLIRKHNIKNVLVTGAPFNLVYYTALLKKTFQSLNILADYRDPWMEALNFGMNTLNPARKSQELEKQNYVFETVDYITAPNEFLIDLIKTNYKASGNSRLKFKTIGHFYDPADVAGSEPMARQANSLRIVYAGALYTDSEPYLKKLAAALLGFIDANPSIKTELTIYTDHKTSAFNYPELAGKVKILPPVGEKIFETIRSFDFLVILLSDHNKNFKTTKYFEFLPYKVPYLYIGPAGFVSESIVKDKLGYVLNKEEELIEIVQKNKVNTNLEGFEHTDQYSLKSRTQQIIECLV